MTTGHDGLTHLRTQTRQTLNHAHTQQAAAFSPGHFAATGQCYATGLIDESKYLKKSVALNNCCHDSLYTHTYTQRAISHIGQRSQRSLGDKGLKGCVVVVCVLNISAKTKLFLA